MSSMLLILPIVALAVYSTYRYLRKTTSGGRGCYGCPSREMCHMHATRKPERKDAE